MSWLLFMDESGHDHRQAPYEVRGGIAIHARRLWSFVQNWQNLEFATFGVQLAEYLKELKGARLLDKDRFKWAQQDEPLVPDLRRKLCRSFLTKGLQKLAPVRAEFTAYGQACLEMARGAFRLLRDHDASLFAAAIPCDVGRPDTFEASEFLRKDHVFLLERYFYFLEAKKEHGLLVMDEVERETDRRFVRRLHDYFQKTQTGRDRATWIVPTPFFVTSQMTIPVQAADLCIYCVNWGFRLPSTGMNAATRPEIQEFAPWLQKLQFSGQGYRDGQAYRTFGIVFVPDPYDCRPDKRKETTPSGPPEGLP